MPSNSNDVVVRFIADTSNLLKGISKADGALAKMSGSMASSMGKLSTVMATAGALIGTAMSVGITNATKDAVEFEALMGTIGQTMGQSTDDFVKWQETTGHAMGFSKLEGARLANSLSVNFKQIATSQEDLMNKTTKMMEVTALIRQKTGRTMQDVSDRIRSAMNQEADGADELGVNVRVSAIEASNAFKQMADGKPWAELSTNMQKAILYQHILESTAKNFGTEMANNTSLRVAVFTATLKDMKLALGQAFLPILNRVLPYLTAMASALTRVFSLVAQFTTALFGLGGDSKKGAEASKAQTQALHKQAKAVDGVTNSVKKLRGEASKTSGLASFDEVHTLSTTGGAGGSGGGTGADIPAMNTDAFTNSANDMNNAVTKVSEKVQAFVDNVKEWLAPIGTAWDKFINATKLVGDAIGNVWDSTGFTKFRGWVADMAKWAVLATIDLAKDAMNDLSDTLNIIADILNGDWGKAWRDTKSLFDTANPILAGIVASMGTMMTLMAVEKIMAFVGAISAWTKGYTLLEVAQLAVNIAMEANPIGLVVTAVGLLVAGIVLLYQNWDTVKEKMTAVWDKMKEFGSWASNFGANLWKGITSGIGDAKKWFSDNVIGQYEKNTGIAGAFHALANVGGNIRGWLTNGWSNIKKWFSDNVIGQYAKGTGIAGAFHSLANLGGVLFGYLKTGWGNVKSWVSTNIASPIKSAFSSITSGLGGTIANGFKIIYNKAVGFLNSMIGNVNDFGDSIDAHLPGNVIKHIPTIPKLYNGGITNGKTIAQVGDNVGGREVISPLDKLTGIISNTMAQTLSMRGGSSSMGATAGRGGDIVLAIDGREFARVVKPFQNLEDRRVGTNIRTKPV